MSLKEVVVRRHQLKQTTREFFTGRHYLEVDTPVITVCPGTEVFLHYFGTEWVDFQGRSHRRFLRSSPELHMKRLIAEGIESIFQLGPCFRNNGELSEWHNPEFYMLEWYQMGLGYHEMMAQTEDYLRFSAEKMASLTGISPSKVLPTRFQKVRVSEAFAEFAGIELVDLDPDLAAQARALGVISVRNEDDFESAFFKILIEKVEPAIAQLGGCILYDYPPSQAALAVVEDGRACRFEFYLGRVELCNGFYELTGEEENRARFEEAMVARKKAGFSRVPADEDYFKAMSKFSKPCAGNALGFDRWLTLLCNGTNLKSAISFPGV